MSLEVCYVHNSARSPGVIDDYLSQYYRVHRFTDPHSCMQMLERSDCAAVVSHLDIAPIDGRQMLLQLSEQAPRSARVLLADMLGKSDADVLTWLSLAEIERRPARLRKAIDLEIMRLHASETRSNGGEPGGEVIRGGSVMRRIFDYARQIAFMPDNLCITGETGTGKNVLAHYVHRHSGLPGERFHVVNCAAVPEQLFESEFFGYEKGAFTGANSAHSGYFRSADGGTLVLDEIGELPLLLQSKLLQVIEDQTFYPVGSNRPAHTRARIIALTNRDLKKAIQEGSFRADLFHRLNHYAIHIPPLRKHCGDIPLLAEHILQSTWAGWLRDWRQQIEPDFFAALSKLPFAGNVRDLQNLLREMLSHQTPTTFHLAASDIPADAALQQEEEDPISTDVGLLPFLQRMEGLKISLALRQAAGNVGRAARQLGVSRQNLQHRIKRLQNEGLSL